MAAEKAIGLLASSETGNALDHAVKLKELIHEKRSQHIQRHDRTPGFEFLNMFSNLQETKGIQRSKIVNIVNKQLKPFAEKAGSKFQELVANVWDGLDVDSHSEQMFSITFQGGTGTAHALFVYFMQREDGKYNLKKLLFEGSFTLAADVVVVRKSKSGFWSSSSKDVIQYVPRRGVTQEDINQLLDVIVPPLAGVMASLVPIENGK